MDIYIALSIIIHSSLKTVYYQILILFKRIAYELTMFDIKVDKFRMQTYTSQFYAYNF